MTIVADTAKRTPPQDKLTDHLVSMARTVELSVERALAGLSRGRGEESRLLSSKGAGEIFLLEPRINEMEMIIDDLAVRMLRSGQLSEDDIRQVVATLKITNDLERMGDLAVNLAERIVSLSEMAPVNQPPELAPMIEAVRSMVKKSLGALTLRNVAWASEVLESDDLVDRYRDQIFERLMIAMTHSPTDVAPNLQLVLASRYLERLADHATNVAEETIFWVRGLDVRHGRAISMTVIENS